MDYNIAMLMWFESLIRYFFLINRASVNYAQILRTPGRKHSALDPKMNTIFFKWHDELYNLGKLR